MKFDLHCHSNFSDGSLSPQQLLELAKDRGISHLALTDHDTVAGLEQARLAATEYGVELINGIELSCSWRGQLLHIVALGIDPQNQLLQSGISANIKRREDRAVAMIADFLEHGIDLADEVTNIFQGAVPTRPHFADSLVNLGYAKNKNQAFKRYLVRGKPGYIAMQWPSLEDIAEWVSAAGGIAVLAHPMRYKLTRTKLVYLIEDMKQVGIRGIEVSTPVTDQTQIDMLLRLAIEHDLLCSMGSDFHSPDQSWARLGSAKPLPDHVNKVWSALAI